MSTGPRSPGGRARASRNALKHGLAAARWSADRGSIAAELVQDMLVELDVNQEIALGLLPIVEAEIDLLRARQVRTVLLQGLREAINDRSRDNNTTILLDQLTRVDRYERRALSRRKFAIRDLAQLPRHPDATSADACVKLVSDK